jgi:hypothetical protein
MTTRGAAGCAGRRASGPLSLLWRVSHQQIRSPLSNALTSHDLPPAILSYRKINVPRSNERSTRVDSVARIRPFFVGGMADRFDERAPQEHRLLGLSFEQPRMDDLGIAHLGIRACSSAGLPRRAQRSRPVKDDARKVSVKRRYSTASRAEPPVNWPRRRGRRLASRPRPTAHPAASRAAARSC